MNALLALSLLLTDCIAVGGSQDMQYAVNHAKRQLVAKRCDVRDVTIGAQELINRNGRKYWAVTLRSK